MFLTFWLFCYQVVVFQAEFDRLLEQVNTNENEHGDKKKKAQDTNSDEEDEKGEKEKGEEEEEKEEEEKKKEVEETGEEHEKEKEKEQAEEEEGEAWSGDVPATTTTYVITQHIAGVNVLSPPQKASPNLSLRPTKKKKKKKGIAVFWERVEQVATRAQKGKLETRQDASRQDLQRVASQVPEKG